MNFGGITIFTLDAHCDTIGEIVKNKYDFTSNRLQVNTQMLKNMENHVQFFGCFIDQRKACGNVLIDILKMIEKYDYISKKYSEIIEPAYSYEQAVNITAKNKCAGFLWLEGGDALNGEIAILRILYKLGIRGITLTWNYKNEIACGVGEEKDTGLTKFGYEVISEMNNLGMIIDVSHLGELSFWQVLNISDKPIIASHSNARKICKHKRNLLDEQIVEIAKKGGVIGVCFCPEFLTDSFDASIDDIIRHIEYICGLVGCEHIGFGSDFDGIETFPRGIDNLSKIYDILNELLKRNYTNEQVENIAGINFMRVIKELL